MAEPASTRGLALLVEDDDAMRSVLAVLLEQDGWRVEEATDGREGRRMAIALRPRVIVTDLSMPGMGGVEMARSLQESGDAHPPIVAVTADDSGLRREAEGSGHFVLVLPKPPDPVRLLSAIARAV